MSCSVFHLFLGSRKFEILTLPHNINMIKLFPSVTKLLGVCNWSYVSHLPPLPPPASAATYIFPSSTATSAIAAASV